MDRVRPSQGDVADVRDEPRERVSQAASSFGKPELAWADPQSQTPLPVPAADNAEGAGDPSAPSASNQDETSIIHSMLTLTRSNNDSLKSFLEAGVEEKTSDVSSRTATRAFSYTISAAVVFSGFFVLVRTMLQSKEEKMVGLRGVWLLWMLGLLSMWISFTGFFGKHGAETLALGIRLPSGLGPPATYCSVSCSVAYASISIAQALAGEELTTGVFLIGLAIISVAESAAAFVENFCWAKPSTVSDQQAKLSIKTRMLGGLFSAGLMLFSCVLFAVLAIGIAFLPRLVDMAPTKALQVLIASLVPAIFNIVGLGAASLVTSQQSGLSVRGPDNLEEHGVMRITSWMVQELAAKRAAYSQKDTLSVVLTLLGQSFFQLAGHSLDMYIIRAKMSALRRLDPLQVDSAAEHLDLLARIFFKGLDNDIQASSEYVAHVATCSLLAAAEAKGFAQLLAELCAGIALELLCDVASAMASRAGGMKWQVKCCLPLSSVVLAAFLGQALVFSFLGALISFYDWPWN